MNPTQEQLKILQALDDPRQNFIKIEAVAGAGKTATLQLIVKKLKPKSGIYTAFNKAIIDEGKESFSYPIQCRTLHSLAYQFVIPGTNRKIDDFTYKCIKEPGLDDKDGYEIKENVMKAMERFFMSEAISLQFLDENYSEPIAKLARKYINKMVTGEIACTFGFILKWFHYRLTLGEIKIPPYDLLMLDECGDITEVTAEIFYLLPARKKIMVGDSGQNIYTFMDTINGFFRFINIGTSYSLTTSFRLTKPLAKRVEKFCKATFNPNMIFKGTDLPPKEIETMAYISRTNAMLIDRMIKLNMTATKYRLIRNPRDIFELPLALIFLKPDRLPSKRKYYYLYDELIKFNNSPELQERFGNFHRYLLHELEMNTPLCNAIKLLRTRGSNNILLAYNKAKEIWEAQERSNIVLATAHTSKGLTFDAVHIEEDLNNIIEPFLSRPAETEEEFTELRLAYVAVTRGRYRITNAKFLDYFDRDNNNFSPEACRIEDINTNALYQTYDFDYQELYDAK
jgi:superfamily I DNA/RNA helicase